MSISALPSSVTTRLSLFPGGERLLEEHADVLLPIEDGDVAERGRPIDQRAIGEALEKAVALLDGREFSMRVRGERSHGFWVEIEELVKADEGVADDGPIRRGAGAADAEFDAVGSARERPVFAKELCAQLVAEKVVPAFQTDLVGAQAEAFRGVAQRCTKGLQPRLGKPARRGKWHVHVDAKKIHRENFHRRRTLAGPARRRHGIFWQPGAGLANSTILRALAMEAGVPPVPFFAPLPLPAGCCPPAP